MAGTNNSIAVYTFSPEHTTVNNVTSSSDSIEFKHESDITAVIILITASLSLFCIVGNSLIILSVIQVHKLKTPANYLIVSLAVSDLLVGLIVMPLAIIPEVLTAWPLGKDICVTWVTLDVTLCTASILHLMMISIDRYKIINDPYKYSERRTGKLMVVFIAVAWVVSIIISTTPLLVGWPPDYGPDGKGCGVNQEIGYQMYATFVAFYLPMAVMFCLYGRIYCISRRFSRADAKKHPSLNNNNQEDETSASVHSSYNGSPVISKRHFVGRHKASETVTTCNGQGNTTKAIGSCVSIPIDHNAITETVTEDEDSLEKPATESDWLRSNEKRHNNHLTVTKSGQSIYKTNNNHHNNHNNHHHHHHTSHHHNHLNLKKLSQVTIASVRKFIHHRHRKHKRHTRAIRTLGIIMGLFTACWLPFFVLAVVSPLCGAYCDIPLPVYSAFLWIGWANSCFNPLIYARFNKEYRTPFREILCCKCHRINESVRHMDYIDQYGEPDDT